MTAACIRPSTGLFTAAPIRPALEQGWEAKSSLPISLRGLETLWSPLSPDTSEPHRFHLISPCQPALARYSLVFGWTLGTPSVAPMSNPDPEAPLPVWCLMDSHIRLQLIPLPSSCIPTLTSPHSTLYFMASLRASCSEQNYGQELSVDEETEEPLGPWMNEWMNGKWKSAVNLHCAITSSPQ